MSPLSSRWPGLARRFGPILLVALAAVAILASGLGAHLSLHELRERRQALQAFVAVHPLIALAAYVAVYTLAVGLSLPAALMLTLAGGLLFGPWIGGGAAAIGCTAGSTLIFLICRTAVGDLLRGAAGSMTARIEARIRRDAFAYLVALRLVPIAPLWLANLALGFVEIPLVTYVAATFTGLLPVSVIYAGLGASLNRLFASGAPIHAADLMRPWIAVPLIGLALLGLAPALIRRRMRRRIAG